MVSLKFEPTNFLSISMQSREENGKSSIDLSLPKIQESANRNKKVIKQSLQVKN